MRDMAAHDLFDLSGRTALIAGGHGNLAEAMANGLAGHGCNVVLGARRVEPCRELADRIAVRYGVRTAAINVDVSDEDSVVRFVEYAANLTGRLDIAVNSAAAFWSAPPEDVPTDKGWRRIVEINLTGSFLVARETGRHMLASGKGSIINISSIGGLKSFLPAAGCTLSYTTTKGALINLTRDLAAQWAPRGVRVNTVAPGMIAGGMSKTLSSNRRDEITRGIPMGRFGAPDELSGAVVFLASDASSYVTGALLSVDGGQSVV